MRKYTAMGVLLMVSVAGTSTVTVQPQPSTPSKAVTASDLAAIDHILTTTRSVRKRLDLKRPIDPKIIEEAIDIPAQERTHWNTWGKRR